MSSETTQMAFLERLGAVTRARPNAIAIEEAGQGLSYGELWTQLQAAAAELYDAGCRPGDRVLLELGRSTAWVVAALGTWRLGAAFVPLPPSTPPARQRRIEAAVKARCRIDLAAADRAARRAAELAAQPESLPAGLEVAQPDDLAYIIYTSGSSGAPKGVMVAHRGIVPMLADQIRAFEIGPGDRAAWCLSPAFDASISDVGVALLSGATLVIADSSTELLAFARERSITHLDLPPSVLALTDARDAPPSLRTVIVGGEPCPPATVRAWAERVRVVNVYGPTEATVCCSLVVCGREWERPMIGRAIGTAQLRVEGEELWIGGDCVALGYWDDPEQTRARFQDGRFRTGDRIRVHDDGGLEFLGRVDRQRKVRGNLVCPEEIEGRLLAHPAITSARVEIDERGRILAAFESRGTTPPTDASLRAHLAQALPDYMLPHRFRSGSLPRGANGKPLSGDVRLTRVVAIYSRVLRCELGPDDDFRACGGDSLAALEIAVAAAGEGLLIAPEQLLEDGATPRHIARALLSKGETLEQSAAHLRELARPRELERERLRNARVAPVTPCIRTVLLTGATGRLGGQVLAQLLACTDWKVVCLVRGRGRIETGPRVTEVNGDLERLDDGQVDELAESVDAVVHCAARVNMAASYAALAPVNVSGTHALVRLATRGRRLPIHYASTLSVFVATDCNRGAMRSDDRLDDTMHVYGGYAQTKYVAERYLRELGDLGLPITLHRFGLLVGASASAVAPAGDFLAAFLRGACALGCLPEAGRELAIDITPVQLAARAMVELVARAPCSGAQTYHIANRTPATLADIAAALARAGVELEWVDAETWRRRVLGAPGGSVEAAAVLGLCRALDPASFQAYRSFDLFQATGVSFEPTCLDTLDWTMPPGPSLLDPLIAAMVVGL